MNVVIRVDEGGIVVEFVRPPVAQVRLVTQPEFAVDALTTVVRGYKQVYEWEPPKERDQEGLLADINRTKLHTPLEMLQYVWLVRDVTRAFTHQLVRTRVGAAFVQESMRFSDKRVARVLLPPVIEADPSRLEEYVEQVKGAFQTYANMVQNGVPIQDARGVLPHNTLTHVFVSYTLSTLAKTASLRYCCQAQNMKADGEGEWKTVLEQMRASLPEQLQRFVCAPWEAGEVSCGFEASFDRPCAWPEKFQSNLDRLLARRKAPPADPVEAYTDAGIAPPEKAPVGQDVQPSTAPHQAPLVPPVSVLPPPVPPDLLPYDEVLKQAWHYPSRNGFYCYVREDRLVIRMRESHLVREDFYEPTDEPLEPSCVNLYNRTILKPAWVHGARKVWVYLLWKKGTGGTWFYLTMSQAKAYQVKDQGCLIPLMDFAEVPNGR